MTRKYTKNGKHTGYMVEVYHEGLDLVRHLSASEKHVLQGKVNNQINAWEKKWGRLVTAQQKERDRLAAIQQTEKKEEHARDLTEQSKEALEAIERILSHTLSVDDAVDWEHLKDKTAFGVKKPSPQPFLTIPRAPVESEVKTKPSFFTVLLGGSEKHEEAEREKFELLQEKWDKEKVELEMKNSQLQKAHQEELDKWQGEKLSYEAQQAEFNGKVDGFKTLYLEKDTEAIIEYCEMVLNNSEYPDSFPREFEIQFNTMNAMLLVDFQLPNIKDLPSRTMVRYVKARDEFNEKFLSATALNKLYELALYQVVLRTVHELFEADIVGAIDAVTLNGFVAAVNSATGHMETSCIVSLQVSKEEFTKINLSSINAKDCFKSLKGVGSAKLSTVTAVRPILELDTSDKRFRDHYEVADGLDSATNLAAMDWEDFEHLVREVFEKEFAVNGGEVKVTQASSDGGVDAVAFDPDPIRGGKIVIQAKRYTNTVGVNAVRDLYGTVVNEGATKGILVTTADYGVDSYEFAKGKPLTLLNGGHLLNLLEKHGTEAKIDIKEAKRMLKDG
jgi:restriction system protein